MNGFAVASKPERCQYLTAATANIAIRATTIEQFAEQLIVWMNEHEVEWV